MKNRVSTALCLCALVPAPAFAQASAEIPLHQFVQGGQSAGDPNPFYYVNVAIGSPSTPYNSVLVDTGSTGLYLLQGSVPASAYTATSTPFTYGYSSGNQLTGFIATATVYFVEANAGGSATPLATATPIAIGIITDFTCNSYNLDCAKYRAISRETNPNNYGWNVNQTGVMGVAYSGGQAIFNPLAQLTGNYSNGFLFKANQATGVSSPALVVGLTPDNTAGYTFTSFGANTGNGAGGTLSAWNTKSIVTCFTASGSTGCLQSVFDSGAGNATFETAATGGPNSTTTGPVSGAVTIGVDGVMSFSSNLGAYTYAPEHGSTLGYNTGNEIFLYYTVAYDYVNGRIGFQPVGNILSGNTAFTSDSQLGLPGAGVILIGTVTLGPNFVSSRPFYLAQSSYLGLTSPTIVVNGSATLNGTLTSTATGEVFLQGVKGTPSTLTLNGMNLFSSALAVNVQNLNLVVNGALPGTVSLTKGASLGGSGMIVGSVDAAATTGIAPGNSIGTLSVLGNVTFHPNATYTAEIGSPGVSDLLSVAGQAQLGGANLTILPYPGLSPTIGSYTLLSAAGGVSGTFSSLSAPAFGTPGSAFPFLSPGIAYTPTSVLLELSRSSVPYASVAQTANQRQTAAAVDRMASTSALDVALSGLNATTAPAAFDALSGEIHTSLQTGLQQQSVYVRDAAMGRVRQALAQSGEPAAAGARTAELISGGAATLWGQAYGGWGDTNGTSNAAALSSSIGGFMMGIDAPVGEAGRLGLLGGFSQSNFTVDGRSSTAGSDNYDVALYGGARLGDLGLRFGASYTWHDISTSRGVSAGTLLETETSGYGGGTAQVFGELGYSFRMGATTVEPFANAAYMNLSTNGTSESGGVAALTIGGSSFETTYSVLGLRLSHALATGRGPLMLSASAGWQHAFGDLLPSATMAFSGSPAFTVTGVPLSSDAAVLDLGISYTPSATIDVGLHYVGQLASSSQIGAVKGMLSVRF